MLVITMHAIELSRVIDKAIYCLNIYVFLFIYLHFSFIDIYIYIYIILGAQLSSRCFLFMKMQLYCEKMVTNESFKVLLTTVRVKEGQKPSHRKECCCFE